MDYRLWDNHKLEQLQGFKNNLVRPHRSNYHVYEYILVFLCSLIFEREILNYFGVIVAFFVLPRRGDLPPD